jgi:hypothetical protein
VEKLSTILFSLPALMFTITIIFLIVIYNITIIKNDDARL